MRLLRASCLILALGASALSGCADDDNDSDSMGSNGDGGGDGDGDGDGGGGDGAVPQADCASRCVDKAKDCAAPDDVAAQQCGGVCSAGLSESELDCLENSSCAELQDAFFGSGSACGQGDDGQGDDGQGDDGQGDDGNDDGSDASIGDDCSCSDPNADYEQCSGTGSPCGSLSCYVVFGEGICSQSCTADVNGDDCPSGTCTTHFVQGIDVGDWCDF